MLERRGNQRHPCRIRCQLRHGKRDRDATLLDVSRSGLSVHVGVDLGQGELVELVVTPKLRIRAIAWRAGRTRSGFRIGMMLSEVTPAYASFLEGLERRAEPEAVERPKQPVPPPERKPPLESIEPWWRLRVKECDGPRTRVVTLAAPTRAVAIERTVREMGAGWEVLEANLRKPLARQEP